MAPLDDEPRVVCTLQEVSTTGCIMATIHLHQRHECAGLLSRVCGVPPATRLPATSVRRPTKCGKLVHSQATPRAAAPHICPAPVPRYCTGTVSVRGARAPGPRKSHNLTHRPPPPPPPLPPVTTRTTRPPHTGQSNKTLLWMLSRGAGSARAAVMAAVRRPLADVTAFMPGAAPPANAGHALDATRRRPRRLDRPGPGPISRCTDAESVEV